MFSWKKINKSINRTMNNLQKSRRIMGGYLANSVKKNSKNKNKYNKKNRTHKSPISRKSHMSSLLRFTPGL